MTILHFTAYAVRGACAGLLSISFLAFMGHAEPQTGEAWEFCKVDGDGDAAWSFNEYLASVMPQEVAFSDEQRQAYIDFTKSNFEAIDLNRDGLIEYVEYLAEQNEQTRRRYEALDANKDGAIVLDELIGLSGDARRYTDAFIFAGNFLPGNYQGEDGPLVKGGERDVPYDALRAARLGQGFALSDHDRDGKLRLDDDLHDTAMASAPGCQE